MKLVPIIDYLRQRLPIVVRLCFAFLALLVIVDSIPGIVDKEHAHTWVESHLPGFWSLFGFFGCALLIILSKAFGHLGIMTREDYYDE